MLIHVNGKIVKIIFEFLFNRNEWPWEIDGDVLAKGQLKPSRPRPPPRLVENAGQMENLLEPSSESEDDIWWNNRNQVYEEKVKVCLHPT